MYRVKRAGRSWSFEANRKSCRCAQRIKSQGVKLKLALLTFRRTISPAVCIREASFSITSLFGSAVFPRNILRQEMWEQLVEMILLHHRLAVCFFVAKDATGYYYIMLMDIIQDLTPKAASEAIRKTTSHFYRLHQIESIANRYSGPLYVICGLRSHR